MEIGMIGLGRMGANMVRRLMRGGHRCVVFDHSPDAVNALAKENAVGAAYLPDLASCWRRPRDLDDGPGGLCRPAHRRPAAAPRPRRRADDGGNSYYVHDIERCRTAGGQAGPICRLRDERRRSAWTAAVPDDRRPAETVQRLNPIFKTLAPGKGEIPGTPGRTMSAAPPRRAILLRAERCRPLVKMVHNGHRIWPDGRGWRRG